MQQLCKLRGAHIFFDQQDFDFSAIAMKTTPKTLGGIT